MGQPSQKAVFARNITLPQKRRRNARTIVRLPQVCNKAFSFYVGCLWQTTFKIRWSVVFMVVRYGNYHSALGLILSCRTYNLILSCWTYDIHVSFYFRWKCNRKSSHRHPNTHTHHFHSMYLLTKWEGRTGKYLGRGHGVRTERSEVRAP